MKRQPDTRQFFYQNGELTTVNQGGQRHTIFRTGEVSLAERDTHLAASAALLCTNDSGSVLCISSAAEPLAYTAYGHSADDASALSVVRFNGQHPTGQGHYMLGNGYRLYSPELMRFYSPDSLSPFQSGGMNMYTYCSGDPINFSDPSGHFGIPNFLRTNKSLLSITAKKFNKNVQKSTFTKHEILTGKKVHNYDFDPSKSNSYTLIIPEKVASRLQALDTKASKQLNTITDLTNKTKKAVTLDIDDLPTFDTIQKTDHLYVTALERQGNSRAKYAQHIKNQQEQTKTVLGYFQKLSSSNLEATRVRRGLDD